MSEPDLTHWIVVDGWFDGEQLHTGASTLKVVDGRLMAITRGNHGDALEQQGWHVDRGRFLMPGLVDAHVHLFLDGSSTVLAQRANYLKQPVDALTDAARRNARVTLRCGVTWLRDAGDRHGINHQIRDESHRPKSGMAQVRSAGLGIRRAKRYGAFMAKDVNDPQEIRESVCELAKTNDEIKLILTGIIDFDAGAVTDEPQFTGDEVDVVVKTAHEHGRKVMAHCSGTKGLDIAAGAGVDSIEHGFFMDRATLAVMRDKDLAWTPTFCPVHFQWAHPDAAGWSAQTVGNLRRILDSHAEHLRMAHEMGIRLLVGTDAGSMGVEHGTAVFEEVDRFKEAGLPVAAVLRAATAAPRRHFGNAQPVLAVDSAFDAVLLPESPFIDITALRRPLRVWTASGETRDCETA